jgi:hypothetical protein
LQFYFAATSIPRAFSRSSPIGGLLDQVNGISRMHKLDASQQIFLLERDPGVLCRILGLYASRGIDIARVEYVHAAPQTMFLTISAHADSEQLRVLIAKAASLFGVIEAAERSAFAVRL